MFKKFKGFISSVALIVLAMEVILSPMCQISTLAYGRERDKNEDRKDISIHGKGNNGRWNGQNNSNQNENVVENCNGVENGNVKIKVWSGNVKAPSTGTFTFYIKSNHGSMLFVNDMNKALLNGSYSGNSVEQSANVSLEKDKVYLMRIKYYTTTGSNQTSLDWSGPGFTRVKLEKSNLMGKEWNNINYSSDQQKPSKPYNLTATSNNTNSVTLNWTAATDNIAVTGYAVYRDNIMAGTTDNTTFLDQGLNISTTYSYTVVAFDEAMNLSDLPTAVSVTTGTVQNVSDTTVPTQPTNLIQTGNTTTTISIAWDPSTDNQGIEKYEIYRNDTYIGYTQNIRRYTDTSLNPNTAYTYSVRAIDNSNNPSIKSAVLTTRTTATDSTVISGFYGYVNGTGVNLYWSGVTNALGYNIYLSGVSGTQGTKINTSSNVTVSNFAHTSPSVGNNYYTIRPLLSDGSEGIASTQLLVVFNTTTASTAAAVIGFTGSIQDQTVRLSWNALTVTGIAGYYIYTGTSSGIYSDIPVTDFPIVETTYTHTKAVIGENYYIIKPVFANNVLGIASAEVHFNVTNTVVNPVYSKVIVLQVNNRYMTVNGVSKVVDKVAPNLTAPELNMSYGRVFIPISSLVEEMGGSVGWDEATKKVTITYEDKKIEMWIGQSYMLLYKNNSSTGERINMDVAPYSHPSYNRTMLPIRFVIQYLGENVQWNAANQTVTINQ